MVVTFKVARSPVIMSMGKIQKGVRLVSYNNRMMRRWGIVCVNGLMLIGGEIYIVCQTD